MVLLFTPKILYFKRQFISINAGLYYKHLVLAPGSFFVSKFCVLSAIRLTDICAFMQDIPLYTNIPFYWLYWCNTTHSVTFPEARAGRCSRKYLFLKYDRNNTCERVAFVETLQAAITFQIFCWILREWLILWNRLWRHMQQYTFLFDAIYRLSEALGRKYSQNICEIFENCLWWSFIVN